MDQWMNGKVGNSIVAFIYPFNKKSIFRKPVEKKENDGNNNKSWIFLCISRSSVGKNQKTSASAFVQLVALPDVHV